MSGKFLSCDWGSTSLRLRIFNTGEQRVEEIYSGDEGIIKTHNEWQQDPGRDRTEFYRSKLSTYLNALQSSVNEDLSGITMVISGMASSSIGMMPLAYAPLPFAINGHSLETVVIPGDDILQNEILLISGVRSDADVMRGEETELIGYASFETTTADGIYIFPGTHSKHIIIADGEAISFQTFMTGEVFALLSQQSILKSAIHEGEFDHAKNIAAFNQGVSRSLKENLLHEIFTLRANELFSLKSREENYFYLSGLLIGYELGGIQITTGQQIFVCARGSIAELYKRALEVLGHENKTRTFSTQRSDIAVAVGQYRIYQNNH